MTHDCIKLEIIEGLAKLTLTRPEVGNALNLEGCIALRKNAEAIAADGRVRAVLLLAEGNNFCVGGDIGDMVSAPERGPMLREMAGALHEGLKLLAQLDAPLIVGVQGAAAGAGLGLVAFGDIVVAGRTSMFAMAYSAIGLSPDGANSWSLPRLIGLRLTQQMALLNRRLNAEEALLAGLVTEVVDDLDVAERASELAAQIAAGPTLAYGRIRRLLAESSSTSLEQQLDDEAAAIASAAETEDAAEGIAAFLARRKPVYRGR